MWSCTDDWLNTTVPLITPCHPHIIGIFRPEVLWTCFWFSHLVCSKILVQDCGTGWINMRLEKGFGFGSMSGLYRPSKQNFLVMTEGENTTSCVSYNSLFYMMDFCIFLYCSTFCIFSLAFSDWFETLMSVCLRCRPLSIESDQTTPTQSRRRISG